ncbi:MAG: hypothetical protein JSV54_02025 [Chloroflexota bacterium]|nr:MAG: hypothetical protein JSV54_02025 [Chloroflexota bacterium]
MHRKQRVEEIIRRLGKRKLMWMGLRGADARVLLQIPQLSSIFSITAPLEDSDSVSEVCLETLKKRRPDLHTYDPDLDSSPEATEMHRLMSIAIEEPTVVLPFRPNNFFTSAYFPHSDVVEYLGLFHLRQAAFEHKPWVETELSKLGVRTIPWRYYGLYNFPPLADLLRQGPLIVRSCHSEGGAGLMLVREPGNIDIKRQYSQEHFVAVTPYLEPNIPINVNACVFQDGTVSLHAPSLQLIGISSCTNYSLGFCGNDFGQIRSFDEDVLDEFEVMSVEVGKWLASLGYIGAFGIDAILYDGHVYLTEINPRFQNSSVISAEIDKELERPDMYLNHMAAFFGMGTPPFVPLKELAKCQHDISQIICYNRCHQPVHHSNATIPAHCDLQCALLPASDVAVLPEGMLFRAIAKGSVTTDGHTIKQEYEAQIEDFTTHLFSSPDGRTS